MHAPASAPVALTTSSRVPGVIERASGPSPSTREPAADRLPVRRRRNTGTDPTAEIAAVKAAGVRVISLGYGASVNIAKMSRSPARPNDYFYAPSSGELGWVYEQHRAGHLPDRAASGERRREPGALRGPIAGQPHAARRGARRRTARRSHLTSTWSEVSGPAPVTFVDASSPMTDVIFSDPGTYILQLEGSDGLLTTRRPGDDHRRPGAVSTGRQPRPRAVVAGSIGRRDAGDADGDLDRRAKPSDRELRRPNRGDGGESDRDHPGDQRGGRRDASRTRERSPGLTPCRRRRWAAPPSSRRRRWRSPGLARRRSAASPHRDGSARPGRRRRSWGWSPSPWRRG